MRNINKAQINKGYNKFVVIFFIFAAMIVLFTIYFAFAKTRIIITPLAQEINLDLKSDINYMNGQDIVIEMSNSYTYNEISEAEEIVEGYAEGVVTIYNNYSADQPLVATTRLLSEEGVLFRTKVDTTVPVGDSVEVEVIADEIGQTSDIGPSKFEIVALNAVKKDAIYAESTDRMTGGMAGATIVSEADISEAKKAAIDALLLKAESEFSEKTTSFSRQNIAIEILKEEINAEPGQAVASITVNIEARLHYALFPEDNLLMACQSELEEQIGDNYTIKLLSSKNSIDYYCEYRDEKLTINSNCEGSSFISKNSELLSKDMLINKTETQVNDYLSGFESIERVAVKFSPFWVKTTPFIKDNIIIDVIEY